MQKMSLLLQSLHKKNLGRSPIWLYRQAGRYMPQYQEIKKSHSLNTMFLEPELIFKITLLPIQHLDVDAAILFADILTVLEGLGIKWEVVDGKGPVVETCDLDTLQKKENTVYGFTKEAITQLKRELKVPLIGFAGGPFTIATYLASLTEIKKLIYSNPAKVHKLLNTITEATIDYIHVQVEAGVDVIQIFDSWAGLLAPKAFKEFSLAYLKKIKDQIKVPVILFCRGSSHYVNELGSLNPDGIGFDWQGDLKRMSESCSCAIQGNLDPLVLLGSKEQIKKEVDQILQGMKGSNRYIFNLGHGIVPETPFDNVKFLVDYVKSAS